MERPQPHALPGPQGASPSQKIISTTTLILVGIAAGYVRLIAQKDIMDPTLWWDLQVTLICTWNVILVALALWYFRGLVKHEYETPYMVLIASLIACGFAILSLPLTGWVGAAMVFFLSMAECPGFSVRIKA